MKMKADWKIDNMRVHGVWKSQKRVLFNIASEASYVYILNEQKLIKNAILASFWKSAACGQTAITDISLLIRQILVENTKMKKIKCDILGDFQTLIVVSQCLKICFKNLIFSKFVTLQNEMRFSETWFSQTNSQQQKDIRQIRQRCFWG